MGPKTRNARRATIGNVTNVAAINASEVLQSVKIADKTIIAIIERVELEARGSISCWLTAVLNMAAIAARL